MVDQIEEESGNTKSMSQINSCSNDSTGTENLKETKLPVITKINWNRIQNSTKRPKKGLWK